MAAGASEVRFEDVMVYFSAEELGMLEPWQRELYFEVLKENYESLIVIGNPVTSADVIAWFERGERQNGPESQGSRAGSSSANGGLGQIYSQCYTETLEAPKVVDGRIDEEKARYGNVGGTPEDSRVPFMHQGSPQRDECMPHLEKATGGLAGPARSQYAAIAPQPYKCQERDDRAQLEGRLGVHRMVSLQKPPHPCPVCGICFPSCWHLKRHQRIHRGACPDSGGLPDCLDVGPGGTHVEEGSHFCADCGEVFRWYLSFLQHRKSHEEEEVWLCAQCDAAFMYRSDLAMHEESHFEEAFCVSSACGENCVCRFSLLFHLTSQLEKSAENGGTDSQEDENMRWRDGGLGQIHSKRFTETLEAPKVVDGRFDEEKARYGNVGGTPEDSHVLFVHRGSPRRDDCMPHLEKATGGLAGPARSQDAAIAPKPYECQECGDRFRLKGLLGIHQMVSLRKLPHPCPVCGICFPSWWHLKRHQRIHRGSCPDSGGAVWTCARWGTRAEGRLHFCADCGEGFRWYLSFLQHRKSHEEEKVWPCAQCEATFMYQSDLAMHEESHFDDALCVSFACGEHCVCRFSLRLHLASRLEKSAENGGTDSPEDERRHWGGKRKGEERFVCRRCGGQFRLEENLEAHYRYCYKEQLQKHRRRPTLPGQQKEHDKRVRKRSVASCSRNRSGPPSERPPARWACTHCQKSFTSRYSLFKHRQTHKAEERRSATELDQSTRPASGLGGRTLVGIMKKLHKCQECGKRFALKSQLVTHMKAHALESRRQGTSGGEGASDKDHFGKRLRTPLGERAPRSRRREDVGVPSVSVRLGGQGENALCQCPDCGKSLTKTYFPEHQAWHRGVRFMCRLCGSLSNFKSGSHRHLQQHRARGDFSTCPKCGTRSQSKSCFCLIERIYLGQEPLPPLYNQEGVSQPTKEACAKRLPSCQQQTAHPLGSKGGKMRGKRKERSRAADAHLFSPKPPKVFQACGEQEGVRLQGSPENTPPDSHRRAAVPVRQMCQGFQPQALP